MTELKVETAVFPPLPEMGVGGLNGRFAHVGLAKPATLFVQNAKPYRR